ncbi:hypothetical protein [Mastigocoleus testarum]|uniref:hypothetical protein n=1 Tax=Mastigocoleus testarum TaxID=996925 RepID=UPI001379EFBC|nr:hypothetical protein [Mastigocoleus testarum]
MGLNRIQQKLVRYIPLKVGRIILAQHVLTDIVIAISGDRYIPKGDAIPMTRA